MTAKELAEKLLKTPDRVVRIIDYRGYGGEDLHEIDQIFQDEDTNEVVISFEQ